MNNYLNNLLSKQNIYVSSKIHNHFSYFGAFGALLIGSGFTSLFNIFALFLIFETLFFFLKRIPVIGNVISAIDNFLIYLKLLLILLGVILFYVYCLYNSNKNSELKQLITVIKHNKLQNNIKQTDKILKDIVNKNNKVFKEPAKTQEIIKIENSIIENNNINSDLLQIVPVNLNLQNQQVNNISLLLNNSNLTLKDKMIYFEYWINRVKYYNIMSEVNLYHSEVNKFQNDRLRKFNILNQQLTDLRDRLSNTGNQKERDIILNEYQNLTSTIDNMVSLPLPNHLSIVKKYQEQQQEVQKILNKFSEGVKHELVQLHIDNPQHDEFIRDNIEVIEQVPIHVKDGDIDRDEIDLALEEIIAMDDSFVDKQKQNKLKDALIFKDNIAQLERLHDKVKNNILISEYNEVRDTLDNINRGIENIQDTVKKNEPKNIIDLASGLSTGTKLALGTVAFNSLTPDKVKLPTIKSNIVESVINTTVPIQKEIITQVNIPKVYNTGTIFKEVEKTINVPTIINETISKPVEMSFKNSWFSNKQYTEQSLLDYAASQGIQNARVESSFGGGLFGGEMKLTGTANKVVEKIVNVSQTVSEIVEEKINIDPTVINNLVDTTTTITENINVPVIEYKQQYSLGLTDQPVDVSSVKNVSNTFATGFGLINGIQTYITKIPLYYSISETIGDVFSVASKDKVKHNNIKNLLSQSNNSNLDNNLDFLYDNKLTKSQKIEKVLKNKNLTSQQVDDLIYKINNS